ncbi:MAG: histidine--tRNA ligase [Bdellovibrionales bacterium]|nr:histidine--tRNA ligase [Bdellovibrionales bacterium]
MSKPSALPPSGFRDFLPEEALARQQLVRVIADVYGAFGFRPIALSAMENLSTLLGKGGGTDNEKLIFQVLKRGESLRAALADWLSAGRPSVDGAVDTRGLELADLGLRFDLTLPLARFYAKNQSTLPRPFKVFQMGPVWRADRPQKGRYREFWQCDVDVLGASELGAEVECLSAILSVFQRFEFHGLELHLNDRRLLAALGRTLGATDAQWAEALICLDKLDKVGADGVIAELQEKSLLSGGGLERMREILGRTEHAREDDWQGVDGESVNSIRDVREILASAFPRVNVRFNPSLVRGQDYYTGTIFEVRHSEIAGSLAGGGRYNRLLEIFGGQATPAFGGSIGFERLVLLLTEKGLLGKSANDVKVFFPLLAPELRADVVELAMGLRARGIGADVYPDAAKLKQQFKYADERGFRYCAILGGDEHKAGVMKLKDMETGTETTVPLPAFLSTLETLCKT